MMLAISYLFDKFSFIFIQPSCSVSNMPAWTLSLNQLIVKLIEESKSLPLIYQKLEQRYENIFTFHPPA